MGGRSPAPLRTPATGRKTDRDPLTTRDLLAYRLPVRDLLSETSRRPPATGTTGRVTGGRGGARTSQGHVPPGHHSRSPAHGDMAGLLCCLTPGSGASTVLLSETHSRPARRNPHGAA